MNSFYMEMADKMIHKGFVNHELEKSVENAMRLVTTQTYTVDKDDLANVSIPPEADVKQKEAEEILEQEEKANESCLIKSYTSFSGCDIVINFDDKIYGEIQSIDFFKVYPLMAKAIVNHSSYLDSNIVEEYPVVLVVRFALFEKGIGIKEGSNITISYANEYGQRAVRSIFDVHPLCSTNGMSIDSIMNEELFVLCAKDVTAMEEPKQLLVDAQNTSPEDSFR